MSDTNNRLMLWNDGLLFNKLFSASFYTGGEIGVAIFFVIAGYFGVNKEKGSILKTALETAFYGILFGIVYILTIILKIHFDGQYDLETIEEVIRGIFTPVSGGGYWFVTIYMLIEAVIPICNPFLKSLRKECYIGMLIIAWLFWYLIPSTGGLLYSLQRGIFFFSVGAYFQLHSKRASRIYLWVLFIFLMYILGALFSFVILESDGNSFTTRVIAKLLDLLNTGIIVPISAAALFKLFESIEINNRIINLVASSSFGVYLLHDNIICRNLLWGEILNIGTIYKLASFPVMAVLIAFVVYIVFSIVDFMRATFVEKCMIEKACQIKRKIYDFNNKKQ